MSVAIIPGHAGALTASREPVAAHSTSASCAHPQDRGTVPTASPATTASTAATADHSAASRRECDGRSGVSLESNARMLRR